MARRVRGPSRVVASRGYTFIEILFVVALVAVLAGIAVPQSLATVDRSRAWAAARYLSARMAMARAHAVMRAAHVALRFEEAPSGTTFQMFVDGNRNGVRTRDITSRVDVPLDKPARLFDLFPGVAIAVSDGDVGTDAVRIGSTDLLSFNPLGSSTSGSIYIRGRDGSQLAIRVLGATGRTRLQRYVPRTKQWVDFF